MVKSQDELKKVFYIEKVDFLRSMMELALRAHGAEIYTVATLENNFYLLDDLLPDLVIFDVETCRNHLDQLSEYATRTNAHLLAVGNEEDRHAVGHLVKAFFPKPLEAKNLASRILSLLD
jgi:DNA-binding response OmpR family regulator